MKIDNIPYVRDKKQKYASCQGPPTVMMAFKYFLPREIVSFPRLYKKLGYTHGTWFFEMYIVRLFHQHKISAKYYSTENIIVIGNNPKQFKKVCGLDFDNPIHRDELDIENYESAVEYVKTHCLFEKRDIDFHFIKEKLIEGNLVIATINRNILTNEDGYKGHFLLIKGFDEEGFICNDAYLGENLKITYNKFSKAFYSLKEKNSLQIADIVVIGRKKQLFSRIINL